MTRRVIQPTDIFVLLGERLRCEGIRVPSPRLFRVLRIRAERWARRVDSTGEISLLDIHRMLGRLLGWSSDARERAAFLEMALEEEFLCATPHGMEAVESARRDGRRIAFVSDMYLDSGFIRRILEREKLIGPADLLAVSGEWKVSKGSGSIWPRLIAELEVAPDEIFHRGDNLHGDVASPLRAGLKALRLGTAETSRWEREMPRHGPDQIRDSGGLSALSRLARAGLAEPDDFWVSLGAGVLGPLLAGFACWVLEQARRDGVGTVWFLSRDGWLLLEAARVFAGEGDPELEYLCIGRRQLRFALPMAMEEVRQGKTDLFGGSRLASLRLVGSRVGFDEKALLELREAAGLQAVDLSDRLDGPSRSRVEEILASPDWKERMVHCHRQAGVSVRAYLKQMAGRARGKVAVADVGWQGSSQDLLDRLLPETAPLRGYYLGLTGNGTTSSDKDAWLYNRPTGKGELALDRHQRLFEVLLGGASGPLEGYRKTGEGWEPVFAEQEAGEHAPGREKAQAAAIAFVKLVADPRFRSWWTREGLDRFAARNLIRLFEHPTHQDAAHFAEWRVTTDEAHADSVALAGGYDFSRIRRCLLEGEPWAWLWPAASLRNSSTVGRLLMRFASFLRRA